VVFLEHKALYRKMRAKSLEPDLDYTLPFGHGRTVCEGSDVTIVTWGATVYHATELARQMKPEGRSLEIIDLRTLVPLDEDLIYRSVRKTSRVIILHEDSLNMGFGAEIAARISEPASMRSTPLFFESRPGILLCPTRRISKQPYCRALAIYAALSSE
jgi:2-oxoisovalerate dehydrogenase E1 component